jgi:hypothetical protein
MKIYEVEGHYLSTRGETVEVEAITRERAIELGIIVKVETWAERKAREAREGFEAMTLGQLEHEITIGMSPRDPNYRLAEAVYKQKVAAYDKEQLELSNEHDEAMAKGLGDGSRIPPARSEASNMSVLPTGRAISGK